MSYDQVKKSIESFVFGLNTPSRWGCVPETYKVMTTTGWKGIDELKEGDVLYTWKDGKLHTCVNNKTVIKDHDGDLITFSNKQYGYKQEVTGYHRVLYCPANKTIKDIDITTADKLYTDKYNHNYTLPAAFSGCDTNNHLDISDDEIQLAAMIYTDGCLDWRGNNIHKVSYFKSIRRQQYFNPEYIFDNLGLKYSKTLKYTSFSPEGVNCWTFYGDDAKYIVNLVGNKSKIDDKFLTMDQHQAQLFRYVWCLHDGDLSRFKAQCDNREILDTLAFINVLAGNISSNTNKLLKSNKYTQYSKTTCVEKVHFETAKRYYKGRVWCPSSDDGTAIFMNDEGGTFISGNCQSPFTNITLDWTVPNDLAELNCIVGGKEMPFRYKDCKKEMDMINKAFIEIMIEGDANGRGFQYPIN